MNKCGDWWGQGNGDWATRHLTEIALMYEQVWGVLRIGGLVTRDLTEIALALGMTSVGLYGGEGIINSSSCRYGASPRPNAAGSPPLTAPYRPPSTCCRSPACPRPTAAGRVPWSSRRARRRPSWHAPERSASSPSSRWVCRHLARSIDLGHRGDVFPLSHFALPSAAVARSTLHPTWLRLTED